MGDYHEFTDQYKVPVIAKLLHALPHYNITFHKINSTFRPNDEIYLESLGILGSVPAALLIVSLLGLLFYLMTRCCDRKPRPAHSITSLKVALSIVTVMCCAAIGLGLYGNDDLHNGLLEVLTAGRKVDNLVTTIRNQTHILENTLTNRIRPQLVELADIFDQPVSNQTALSKLFVSLNIVQGNVTLATNAASDIRRPLMGISMTHFLTRGDQWELIRWPGTVATLALLLVLCAVLLVGVARHSRCALILFSVCGLLAVTGSWLMSGLYLSSSVAVGDLCISPADFLVSTAPRDLPTNVLLHYTQCEPGHTNPFTQRLRESQNSLNNARSAMATVMKISLVLFKSSGLQPKLGAVNADLNSSERLLTQLTALVDCKAVHHNFLAAARGLCEGGLLGLVLMLIASFIAAILLTIMVWVDSHTWIYIRKRNDYAQVDEPSYISHPAPQNHQQMMNAARTLPRNHNGHFSPPVISGSHTLQHPSKRQQHEMMAHAHIQQNMRAMGTHTLGRLPSHNHSPTHMSGPNNAAAAAVAANLPPTTQAQQQQQQQQAQQQLQQQQMGGPQQPQPIYCHHPHSHPHAHPHQHPHTHSAAAVAAAVQHQHAIYHQQQAQAQAQYGTYTTAAAAAAAHHAQHHLPPGQSQIYQQIPAHLAPQLAANGNPHSIYQPLVAVSQGSIYVSNLATMRRQNSQGGPQIPAHHVQQPPPNPHHQQQQQQLQQQHQHPQQPPPPSQQQQQLHQLKSPQQHPQQQQQQQQHHPQPESDVVPISTTMDTSIYDRDKQIYKCSTLRQGGKFDPKYKPSILNCPLPEIPKDAEQPKVESIYQQQQQAHHQNYSKTLQRPPMKLPPQMKAIPPPRIGTPTSPPPPQAPQATQMHDNGSGDGGTNGEDTSLPPPPLEATQQTQQTPPKARVPAAANGKAGNGLALHNGGGAVAGTGGGSAGGGTTNDVDDDDLPPPPPAITDESNYAVTEL
ncbi:protein tweety [Drosophila willistoni]|uniref:protein tweety n=1 Tax=Drosophila willistoni TaxID=7260 RepID=UPI00017D7162|nr:protein tweety [Drosophila willistoni]XP_023031025.1 protein tweety [Drosophila willistoni]XP_023031026.1 protein tweety [Drosophila willistoni]